MDTPTPDTAAADFADAPRSHGDSFALIKTPDMVDRIVEMGIQARGIELVEVTLPHDVPGLPKSLKAIVRHTEAGPVFERLRPLFDDFRTAPERKAGIAKVSTLQSFIDLANRHKDADSAIFAKTLWPMPGLTAVLDYHRRGEMAPVLPGEPKIERPGEARFGTHRIEYLFPLTEEFRAWMAMDGKPMDQHDFALFLEEHVDELAAPYDAEIGEYERLFKERLATPIELVDLSRSLEIHEGRKIKRQERLASGERSIVFESEHTTATGEKVDIPGVFMISVRAFLDGDPVRIPARLRYRTKGGDITWSYQLYRPDFWLRTRVQEDLQDVAARTDLPTFEGEPEYSTR